MVSSNSAPIRRVSTRVRRTSPRQGPRAPEHLVERMVVAAIGMVNAYTDRLMRALSPLLEARFGARQDAATERPGRGGVAGVFEQLPEGELTKPFLEKMFVLVDRQAADDLQRVVPVPLKDVLPNAAAHQKAWVDRNTSLIRLEERAQKEVAGILDGPLREGIRVEEVRKRIQERLNVVRSRAELIARDQTLKLYGQVQEQRQTEAGIVEYTWSTSEDERVRGNPAGLYPKSHGNHWRLEGTTQRWDTPPVVDAKAGRREHPGGDFQCRCAAIPILPTDLSEEPANDVPRGRAPQPANDVPLRPEEQELGGPLPPDPVEQERQRLAEERAAREAERRAAEERARVEAERRQAEQERLAREARQQRAATARQTIERYAERVQIAASTSPEVRDAAAAAVEKVGLRGINVLRIEPELGVPHAEGLYFPGTADLKLKSAGLQALGETLPEQPGPGKLWSMGTQPGTQAEAARNTMYHELGHHAHLQHAFATAAAQRAVATRIDRLIQERWRARDREYLTDYAHDPRTPAHLRAAEYFAEAFAAYHAEPDWLLRVAPRAHALVADVLRLRKDLP